ncbi:MAG: TerC family protein [Bacteroidales bacterium]|jgi:tellurite resistance protein TerC|nr:TerC family protein [Bacteroidales bacterium]
MVEGIGYWIGFIVFVIVMLMLDLGVFHKKDSVIKIKEAILWSVFWIALALLFNVGIYFFIDHTKALEFFTAYILEKSLSVDNLFVFIMIFSYFNIDPKYQHKILFWGIIGALVMRAIFIFAGVAIIQRFSWVMYIFGVFLIYTGIHMLFEKKGKEDFDPNRNIVIRLFRKIMPVTEENTDGHFFIRKNGKLFATTFFITLLFIEVSDLIFAVDSIPAVLSVSNDTFIVFTSNIFAILGLRSLYFALNGIMAYFSYLKYALAFILSFIGLKMCINELMAELGYNFHISNFVSLGVIIGTIIISVLFSIYKNKKNKIEIDPNNQ